jgi:putative Holliday junction resolvase
MLAIDLGSKRIGTAISDALGISVRPVETIRRSTTKRVLSRLKELVEELQPEAVVVGLPLRMDGSEGEAARKATRFAQELRGNLDIEVFTQDERLTSYEAEETMAQLGYNRQRRRERSDCFAAMIILRDYLATSAVRREEKP